MKEAMAQMASSIAQLSKEVMGLKAAKTAKSVTFKGLPPLVDVVSSDKGKELDPAAGSEEEGEEDLEMLVAPGDSSVGGEDEGLPKPIFATALEFLEKDGLTVVVVISGLCDDSQGQG
jgi:hypothetical protein